MEEEEKTRRVATRSLLFRAELESVLPAVQRCIQLCSHPPSHGQLLFDQATHVRKNSRRYRLQEYSG